MTGPLSQNANIHATLNSSRRLGSVFSLLSHEPSSYAGCHISRSVSGPKAQRTLDPRHAEPRAGPKPITCHVDWNREESST